MNGLANAPARVQAKSSERLQRDDVQSTRFSEEHSRGCHRRRDVAAPVGEPGFPAFGT